MHEAADNKSRSRTTSQVQRRSFLDTKVSVQAALGKEVCRELNSTAETGSDHGSADSTINTLDALAFVDLAQAVK